MVTWYLFNLIMIILFSKTQHYALIMCALGTTTRTICCYAADGRVSRRRWRKALFSQHFRCFCIISVSFVFVHELRIANCDAVDLKRHVPVGIGRAGWLSRREFPNVWRRRIDRDSKITRRNGQPSWRRCRVCFWRHSPWPPGHERRENVGTISPATGLSSTVRAFRVHKIPNRFKLFRC